ncbi:MAG: diacylglycerol kinase family protein [Bacteroidota bacterium]
MDSITKSVKCGVDGMVHAIRSERNLKIHCAMAVGTVTVGFILNITLTEWGLVLCCISIVFGLELLNTAIEQVCNLIEPNFDAKIGIIKDISAGAVLVASIFSAIVGLIIFLPLLLNCI